MRIAMEEPLPIERCIERGISWAADRQVLRERVIDRISRRRDRSSVATLLSVSAFMGSETGRLSPSSARGTPEGPRRSR